jgi:hypothetical protein
MSDNPGQGKELSLNDLADVAGGTPSASNELSQTAQLAIQNQMDQVNKEEQTISNIVKQQQDNASNIIKNLK